MRLNFKLIRFIIAGVVNTLFGWLIYSLFILINVEPWLALIISTVVGILFNFITIGGYAFKNLKISKLPLFILSYIIVYLINILLIYLLKIYIPNLIVLQLLLTPILALISYFLLSKKVFVNYSRKNRVQLF